LRFKYNYKEIAQNTLILW